MINLIQTKSQLQCQEFCHFYQFHVFFKVEKGVGCQKHGESFLLIGLGFLRFSGGSLIKGGNGE